jgi:hypothetical protein
MDDYPDHALEAGTEAPDFHLEGDARTEGILAALEQMKEQPVGAPS